MTPATNREERDVMTDRPSDEFLPVPPATPDPLDPLAFDGTFPDDGPADADDPKADPNAAYDTEDHA
jgi:hypothetical protein